MPLLKLFHLAALIVWCGALLYLPALIRSAEPGEERPFAHDPLPLARFVFNLVASPAALLAIASGTLLFLRDGILDLWLVFKLTAVAALVLGHAVCGMLVLRAEQAPQARCGLPCALAGACNLALIGTILWLVLAKPV